MTISLLSLLDSDGILAIEKKDLEARATFCIMKLIGVSTFEKDEIDVYYKLGKLAYSYVTSKNNADLRLFLRHR
jgi:hypothetical protein